jgi:DNA-binding NtrC family response regulator
MATETERQGESILIVDDEEDFAREVIATLKGLGFEAAGARNPEEARTVLNERYVDLMLVDEWMGRDETGKELQTGTKFLRETRATQPGMPAVLISGHAHLEMAVKAMRAGACDMLPKPFTSEQLQEVVRRNLEDSALVREARRNRWFASKKAEMAAIVGESPAIKQMIATIRRVASSTSTVLVEGESGTGKELVARAIHEASPRKHREMVAENFGALQQSLLESTLFGAKRGAFTGADRDRPGLFELASGSTLFLDEIGECPLDAQTRLLRVLEERTVTRLGDTKARAVDVRLVAATNRDLAQRVQQGLFRADLYYRLKVVQIKIPPLRERPEDIEPIAMHLLAEICKKQAQRFKGFDAKALEKLRQYHWPGNARELRNVVENAVVAFAQPDWIQAEDLIVEPGSGGWIERALEGNYRDAAAEFDRRYFERLLKRAKGNKTEAADLAGIDRSNIYKHLERAGLESRENTTRVSRGTNVPPVDRGK